MTATKKTQKKPAENEIVIARVFDAPRETVFKTWTEPERLKRWWGPRGFTCPFAKIDLREGGVYHSCMRAPDGKDYWSKGVYREVVVPERLVSTDCFSDEAGHIVSPTDYGLSAGWPREALVTVTFEEQAGKTKLTIHHGPVATAPGEERDMCRKGWGECLDKLAEELARG